MKPTRPADGQGVLGFVRSINRVLRRPLGLTPEAKHLLRVFLAEPYQTVWMSEHSMADAMSTTSRSYVQRAKRELVARSLIGKVENSVKGRQSARWQICTANLFALAEESDRIVIQGESSFDGIVIPRESQKEVGGIQEEEIPPPTSSIDDEWQAVVDALSRFRLDQAAKVADDARARGCTPAEIMALLQYAQAHPGNWKSPAGALYWRITYQTPGRPISEAWAKSTAELTTAGKPLEQDNLTRVHTQGKKFWDAWKDDTEVIDA